MTVAVVVPAYNEEGFVGDVIDELPEFVDRAYVVDDGSTDGTWAEIQAHSDARNEGHDGHFADLVVPIRHRENRGVGGAIKTGYERAREERIDATAVLGGDHQMNPVELTRYLDPIADGVAEYTKGNRFSRPGDWAEMPRFRLLGNVVLSYLTKIASGYWGTMDSQNGYTAISLSALERTEIEGMYEYYGYCNDLLVRLNAAEVRVADVARSSEYAYADGWKSHIDYTEYIPRVSGMLFRSFLWRLQRKYLMTGYSPVAPLYLLGTVVSTLGGLGLLKSVLTRDGEAGTWTLATTAGLLAFITASSLDQENSDHLEVQVAPDDAPEAVTEPDEAPEAVTGPDDTPEAVTEPDDAPEQVTAPDSDAEERVGDVETVAEGRTDSRDGAGNATGNILGTENR